jgi:adenosylcobinamide-GDP ribazoletransferase
VDQRVDGLRRALGFLTVYPLRASDAWTPETLGSSMVYYPLVGLFIGFGLWVLFVLLSALFVTPVVNVLLLGGLVFMTGGLHVDGLADTVDGLNGGYSREETLTIFKDPHVGPTAVVCTMLVLLLKYVCLNVLPYESMLSSLVLMTTLSRYSMVQLAYFSPYARPTGGLGEPFVHGVRQEHFRAAVLLTLTLAWLCGGMRGVMIAVLISLATIGYQMYYLKRLGGITGDVLGATNEINEALILLLTTMMY